MLSFIITLTVLGTLFGIAFGDQNDHNNGGQYVRYARELSLSLRPRSASPQASFAADLPPECECAGNTVRAHRQRKGGRRGGVRQRFRRRSTRPPLPGVILGNVRSLRSKMDELHANVKFLTEYRDANLLCFSETWLDDTIDSRHLHVDGFGAPVRADRTEASGKQKGGGLCFFINERWCSNCTVKRTLCTPDIELLSISCRPFYLPREFSTIFAVLVYVPPSANYTVAAETITQHMNELDNLSPSAPKLLLGDFNGCSLRTYIPTYKQYVTCMTRGNKIIDLCYCNIKNAYKSVSKPPLGTSDHNIIQLLPTYKSVLKTGKIIQKL